MFCPSYYNVLLTRSFLSKHRVLLQKKRDESPEKDPEEWKKEEMGEECISEKGRRQFVTPESVIRAICIEKQS